MVVSKLKKVLQFIQNPAMILYHGKKNKNDSPLNTVDVIEQLSNTELMSMLLKI